MSLREVLTRFKVKPETIDILEDQQFDLDILRDIPDENLIAELKDTDPRIVAADAIKIKKWKKSLNPNAQPQLSQNVTRRVTRSQSRSRSRSKSKPRQASEVTKNRNGNSLGTPPQTPLFFHETSVSEQLLTELAQDDHLRTYMDQLMNVRMQDLYYMGKPIHLKEYENQHHFSDLKKDKRSIYYSWHIDKEDKTNTEAYHLSLNHTINQKHSNRSGFDRVTIGAFHLRVNNTNRTLRKILINLVNGIYEITVCKTGKRRCELDNVADHILLILVEYYTNTGRRAEIIDGRC